MIFKLYDPDYHLSLQGFSFDNNDSVPRDNANLHYSIKNTGAAFDGELQVSYYQNAFSRGKSEIRQVHIATNETLTDSFSGPLEQVAGTYDVVLRYRDSDSEWKEFIDINDINVGAIVATIYDDSISTNILNLQSSNSNYQLLMRLGAYDLYLVTIHQGDKLEHKKIFVPVR